MTWLVDIFKKNVGSGSGSGLCEHALKGFGFSKSPPAPLDCFAACIKAFCLCSLTGSLFKNYFSTYNITVSYHSSSSQHPTINICHGWWQAAWFQLSYFWAGKRKIISNIKYYIIYVNNVFLRFLNKIVDPSYVYIFLFNAQNLPYYIQALTNLSFFSVKSRHL